MQDPAHERPFGVTLIAFVTVATAILPLLALARAETPATQPAGASGDGRRPAQMVGLWAAVGILAAAGLFGLRRWGWWLAVVYYGGAILFLALNQPPASIQARVFQGGLSVLVVWYLLSHDVRVAFRHR